MLANAALTETGIDWNVAEFALRNLSRSELAQFLLYFEKTLKRRSVTVTSHDPLPGDARVKIEHVFAGSFLFFEEDTRLGGGIKVSFGDSAIDLSVKGYIEKTLSETRAL